MKKALSALLVCMCILFMGCSNPVKNATKEYIKANGSTIMAIAILERIGGNDVDAKIEILQWDDTPIDTITREDFCKYELKKRINAANDYKKNVLQRDSKQVAKYRKDLANASGLKEVYREWLNDASQTLKLHQQEYQKQVDQINKIKEIAQQPNKDDVIYLVYHFTERINFKHPVTGEKVSRDFNCFSYVDMIQYAVTYVDEGRDDYSPAYWSLHSPMKFDDEEEEELELL